MGLSDAPREPERAVLRNTGAASSAGASELMAERRRGKSLQRSQREALIEVGKFAALLAHEVRNPLTAIRIDLQHVEEQLPPESPLRLQLARALREVERLDQTVSGALRIARSGTVSSDLVDLRVPLLRAIEVATPAFDQIDSTLALRGLDDAPVPVRGDEAALEQLFLNLLLNAAQALQRHGTAGVILMAADGHADVELWDRGIGIEPGKLGRVFDAFYSTKKDGTGLGLAIARGIVTGHGGLLEIESRPGDGTTVSIRLPLAR
jgi:signal transduction histidine kinase